MTLSNGDPGGSDPFDGGCPADTIPARVLQPEPVESGVIYGVLNVWLSDSATLGPIEFKDRASAEAYASSRNRTIGIVCNSYVVRIPVPAFKEIAK